MTAYAARAGALRRRVALARHQLGRMLPGSQKGICCVCDQRITKDTGGTLTTLSDLLTAAVRRLEISPWFTRTATRKFTA